MAAPFLQPLPLSVTCHHDPRALFAQQGIRLIEMDEAHLCAQRRIGEPRDGLGDEWMRDLAEVAAGELVRAEEGAVEVGDVDALQDRLERTGWARSSI